MFYEYTLNVPADTKEAAPYEIDALVEPGILTYAEIDFPPGCHGLVNVSIVEGKFQLFPRNPEEAVKGDGYVVPIKTQYKLKRGHNLLKLKAWSPDTAYSHKIVVRLTVETEEADKMFILMSDFVAILKKLIGVD